VIPTSGIRAETKTMMDLGNKLRDQSDVVCLREESIALSLSKTEAIHFVCRREIEKKQVAVDSFLSLNSA